ncbi:amino acid/amide ABC transporter membrane protein 2, HAAT family [Haloechinothrix alba]|uniref:Amino acid/amide ABC transporter membrane protein 2, HAAT family n=1 Tax=Haloechinothrix alba TaxID=664784 RepID=A0A238W8K0_9PSEU|nr:branched-chain amino acid ABC transporter permease [Haloechinothrix alba]SNR42838.1 amino acid/amide ABC transporter membrane protein 2, HAAT family [Haloechinothrix alba]
MNAHATVAPTVESAGAATPRGRRDIVRVVLLVTLVLCLVGLPLVADPFATTTATRVLAFALLAVSLDLLVGVTGLPSLGHAAYFGVGAYTAGWLSIHIGIDGPVALLAATLAGASVAAATGWLAVRSGGIFFLMLTLAIGEVLHQVAHSWRSVTGGSDGMYGVPATTVGGVDLANPGFLYWYVLGAFGVGYLLIRMVVRSSFGAALRGIHDNEPRMRALGYPVFGYKLAAFVIAGAGAGLAGGLLVAQQRIVTPDDLGFTTGALVLLAVVIGGAGTLWGACIGAAVVVLVRDYFGPALDGHGPLLLGIVFVIVVYVMPRGVAGVAGIRGKERAA